MELSTFTAAAATAGIDINARGGKAAFARALGCYPAQVSTVLSSGNVTPTMAEKAEALTAQVKSGALKPAGQAVAHEPTPEPVVVESNPEDDMSDSELLEGINKRFTFMHRFADFAVQGKFHAVLVTGPGGIGKTYPIERMLREVQENHPNRAVRMVSGAISAVKLYEMCWETRNKGDVLLIDDADGGLANVDFLNVLKAATDSKGRRVVSWLKQNRALAEAGVEPTFEYKGSIIIISNANMKEKAAKGNGHMDAVLSRAMHIDLGINSKRALALRVAYMIEEQEMFAQMFASAGMPESHDRAKHEISGFIKENREAFRSLTLREAAKIAKMWIACEGDDTWRDMALLSLGAL